MIADFNSRRSVVHSTKGMVASTQPLANAAGIKVLEAGGNAAMAAVAVAAALGVTEPMMNGPGGDAFGMFYDAKTKKVSGFNSSGKTPANTSLDQLLRDENMKPGARIPKTSIHSVTVPGAVASWEAVMENWGNGKVSLKEVLQPAIELAENGFPVSEITAHMWEKNVTKLHASSPNHKELLIDENSPSEGQLFVNRNIANVLKKVAEHGKDGFYKGEVADKIIDIMKQKGGEMTHDDLTNHETLFIDPISLDFEGVTLHELPPNGQGIVALQTLGVIDMLSKRGVVNLNTIPRDSTEYLHLIAETLKFSFKDAEEYITDYEKLDYDPMDLISDAHLKQRAELFDHKAVNHDYDYGVLNPDRKSDTVYFTVTDAEGNACSFITSIYDNFGSAIIPEGTGFTLQNRGCNFGTLEGTRNCYAGGKRSFHTIIPAMITKKEDIYATYGIMGGWVQAQNHVQVLNNMVLFGMNPQQALDAPRIALTDDSAYPDTGRGADSPVSSSNRVVLAIEEGIDESVEKELQAMGHKTRRVKGPERTLLFGRGQIIKRGSGNVWSGASDPRGDGAAVPQL